MSKLAQQITGTLIEDEPGPKPPVLAWIQEEMRHGALKPALHRFIKSQPEHLDTNLVLVDTVSADKIICRIPFCICDHENPSPSRSEVVLAVDPVAGTVVRTG